ncbi:Kinesin light chain (KLC), partial [Durusdinium trenchii]
FEEVLALNKQQLGENHPKVLSTRAMIAKVLQSKGEYDAALAQFEEVLALRKQQLGENHPSVLSTRYAIAQVLRSKGEYEAALAQFEEVLALRRQQLGENHPSVLTTRHAIAQDAAEAAARGLGEEHPELAAVWHAWGVGPPRDKSKLQAALDLREARLGEEHPLTRKTRAALQG